jgi:hypothetical protein
VFDCQILKLLYLLSVKVPLRSISYENKKTILFLAANPKNTTDVDLQKEAKDIAEGLQRSKKGDSYQREQQWVVTPREMQGAVLDYVDVGRPGVE